MLMNLETLEPKGPWPAPTSLILSAGCVPFSFAYIFSFSFLIWTLFGKEKEKYSTCLTFLFCDPFFFFFFFFLNFCYSFHLLPKKESPTPLVERGVVWGVGELEKTSKKRRKRGGGKGSFLEIDRK
eukprot:TRINITY_DN3756_c1_g2_i1.p1 TRINITY_DN3756_c1_g2~~TRINITY_DN3756_c1_g2_i1.p1  ORF type:complete len:126 (-),score=4.28 TRINITY_DN3756_c1_g2_i1:1163-1540(-)